MNLDTLHHRLQIAYNIGLQLPGGPAILMQGRLEGGRLVFGRRRECLKAAEIEALQVTGDECLVTSGWKGDVVFGRPRECTKADAVEEIICPGT